MKLPGKKGNEPLLMSMLCQLDRFMFMGGRVLILLDGVSEEFSLLMFMYWERIITAPGERVGGIPRPGRQSWSQDSRAS